MELSYEEKILKAATNRPIIDTLQIMGDCFAVQRLRKRIGELSGPAGFNEGPRKEIISLYEEIDIVLEKYGIPTTKSEDDEQ